MMFTGFQVHGLLRKPRNGAPFYIQIAGNPMKGWASVLRREKTPTGDLIHARLMVSGTEFCFHSKDKQSWPDAAPKRGVKIYKSKKN
jgi:hypothetical protein